MQEINNAKQESSAQNVSKLIRLQATGGLPLLVVLSGPSHAGKSTFARWLGDNFTTISSDEIRRELNTSFESSEHEAGVWGIFESMKCKALKEGRDVILDACHMSPASRWHSLQGPNGRHRKICVVFDLPLRTIRDRCIEAKRLSLQEALRMWGAFQNSKPTPEELRLLGFDEIYSVTGNPEYDARINGLNLKNRVVGKGKRQDIDTLLYAIIGEAEVALMRKNFEPQVEHLYRLVFTIVDRIKRWEDEKAWSEIDRLMEKVEGT